MRLRWTASILVVLVASCSPAPRPGPVAGTDLKISNVLVLPLPSGDLLPSEEEQALVYLGRQLHQVHKLNVYCGRAVGRSVWGARDTVPGRAKKGFLDNLKVGKQSLKQLRVGKALTALDQARAFLPYCGAELQDFAPVIDLHLTSGLALLSQGKTTEAESEFRRAISYDNQLDPASRNFRPDQLEVFERARKQLLSGNQIPVKINSIPPGAKVTVDGRPAGVTPATATGLYPGRHFVRIEHDDYTTWTINLPDGFPPSAFDAQLVPRWTEDPPTELFEQAFQGTFSDTAEEQLKQIAAFFRVDAVILTRLERSAGKLVLVSRRYLPTTGSYTPVKRYGLGNQPKAWEGKIRSVVRKFIEMAPEAEQPAKQAVEQTTEKPEPQKEPKKKKKKKSRKRKKIRNKK